MLANSIGASIARAMWAAESSLSHSTSTAAYSPGPRPPSVRPGAPALGSRAPVPSASGPVRRGNFAQAAAAAATAESRAAALDHFRREIHAPSTRRGVLSSRALTEGVMVVPWDMTQPCHRRTERCDDAAKPPRHLGINVDDHKVSGWLSC